MSVSRRRFLGTAAVSLGLAGLRSLFDARWLLAAPTYDRFGPLLPDPDGILALPEGFSYRIVSRAGERMDDGFLVPARHDGMATFPGPDGTTLLIRNHEVDWGDPPSSGPFGSDNALLRRLDPARVYDAGAAGTPALGGTTTLLYDTLEQELVGHRLSLVGTVRNCAGGPTPWGTWVSCEETVLRAGRGRARDHGYCFEVPARWGIDPVEPVPLVAMGRFEHEAVAVDPGSGAVYETEDHSEGLFYRYLPDRPGDLAGGGRLQALAVLDHPSLDTRNWRERLVGPGEPLPVRWIDVHDVESPDDDLRYRGFEAGAARFARGEGIWRGRDGIYFACTNGGSARKGQIWRYVPGPHEGTRREVEAPATVELFLEPNDSTLVENADNLTTAPWGDLFVCEDGAGDDYLVGVTPEGELYRFARNLAGNGELAGACFSADGSTLFMNMQLEGWTVAITGPWERATEG